MKALIRSLTALALAATTLGSVHAQTSDSTPRKAETIANPSGTLMEHSKLNYGDTPFFRYLDQRLTKLGTQVLPEQAYNHGKAQCWLMSARDRFDANKKVNYDYVEHAIRQSSRIAGKLEQHGKQADRVYETPLPNNAVKVRDDLWQRAAQLRDEPQFACGAQSIACGEVALVHAGHIQQTQGAAAATAAIAMAEQAIGEANTLIAACAPKPTATPQPTPTPVPVLVEAAPVVTMERYVLPGDALFKFGKGGLSGMLPEGRDSLQTLLDTVRTYQSIESITVTGHTDKFNTEAFNQALSERRANTVRDWLVGQGFDTNLISVIGAGESMPLVTGCGDTRTKKTIACLQPNRRVEVLIQGIKQ